MEPISVEEMGALEEKAFAKGISALELMERAGKECACIIGSGFQISKPGAIRPKPRIRNSILVFCGPGNNGGDGYVCARYLEENNDVSVVSVMEPRTEPAGINSRKAEEAGVRFIRMEKAREERWDVIVDALLGVGAKGPLRGQIKEACVLINSLETVKVAIDIPTGMDADSGECDPDAVRPDATICIHAPKTGIIKAGGKRTGRILVADIGLK